MSEAPINKSQIRETMLSLEAAVLESARENYLDYVATARLDRSEPIENDEQAQAEVASDLAEALDDTLNDQADKLDRLKVIDFGPKSVVTEGAVVKLSGRLFVVAVSTSRFTCHGQDLRSDRRGEGRGDGGFRWSDARCRAGRLI